MTNFVSWYSFLSAMIFFSIALVIIAVLHSRTDFLEKHGVSMLLFVCTLALVRLVLPLDLPVAYLLESWTLIPAVRSFFQNHYWILTLLLSVWGIGAVVVLVKDVRILFHAYRVCQGYRIIKSPRVDELAKRFGTGCPVLVSPDVDIPYVMGFFRHTIYLPDHELSDREIELILMHETQHIRGHDALIKLLWGLLSAVFWWNPAVYKFRQEIDTLLEFRCDAEVTESMNAAERMQYLEMLLNMMKRATNVSRCSALSLNESSALNSPCVAEQRFMVIMNNLERKSWHVGLIVKCALVAVFLASYLVILQPAGHPPINAGELQVASGEVEINDEMAEKISTACIVKIGENYYLVVGGQQERQISEEEAFSDTYEDYIILEEYCP